VARRLAEAGVDVHLFEARDRLGGRVLTLDATGAPGDDGFDLGPSWIWPRMQPAIGSLVDELGLATFAQSSDGDVVFERMSREPAQRYPGVPQDAQTMRLAGGSAALILGAAIGMAPQPPHETRELWEATPTWMAAQAKFVAVFAAPFWLEDGYSGTAQSMVGPMLEMHDATTLSGTPALFGFLGIGPAERRRIGEAGITEACLAQFARLFGPRAGSPTAILYQDWATETLTCTAGDETWTGHPAPAPAWVHGPWSGRLVLAGSEVSPSEAGYLAGAVHASELAAARLLRCLGLTQEEP
jgi:monoamine oxidase